MKGEFKRIWPTLLYDLDSNRDKYMFGIVGTFKFKFLSEFNFVVGNNKNVVSLLCIDTVKKI